MLISPKILLAPQLSISQISFFNTNQKEKTLETGIDLFTLKFNTASILPLFRTYDQIIDKNKLDSAVLNFGFMHNISEMVTRVASLGLNENQSSEFFLAKIQPKNPKSSNYTP